MKLVIARHGTALSEKEDPARPLSAVGRAQAASIGRQLASLGIRIDEIHHSTKARAKQTAEIIAAELEAAPQPETRAGLGPNDPVEPVVRDILDAEDDRMIVGHLPFVQNLTAVLMSHADQQLPAFAECGTVVMMRTEETGAWIIEHSLTPR